MGKNFAITGIAGYIAPKHLKAIKETGNNLVAAVDPHDSVGILDQYFPDVSFFTEFERFDRHLEKLRRGNKNEHVDYVSICSPNHLHDAHIRLALRVGADAICEKPLVLNPWNLDVLSKMETEYGKRVYSVLQLRQHPTLIQTREKLLSVNKKHEVSLSYITSRGLWYNYSWKGDKQKSGGIATNIGIHFFDLLIWFFGKALSSEVHLSESNKMAGFIELQNANVKWFLSIDQNDLPKDTNLESTRTHRSITIDNEEIKFNDGFTELHTLVYKKILANEGSGIEEARDSIELTHSLREAAVILTPDREKVHPFLLKDYR